MPKKVLVVDKDPSVQTFFEKTLPSDKFTLSGINDGISALDMLDKIKPEMILVEFALYGIDIFRFCEKVKQKNQEKERPIILTVAPGDQYDAGRLLALGVMAILKKPLDPGQLLEKMQELSEETATLIDRKPKAPDLPSPMAAPEEEGSMKIEEMLGWSLPGDKAEDSMTQKGPPLSSLPADLEQTVVHRPGENSLPKPAPFPGPAADPEQTLVVPPGGTPIGAEDVFLARPASPASGSRSFDQAMVLETPVGGPGTEESAPAVEAGPGKSPNGTLKSPLDEDQVAEIVRAAAQVIIERVSWDVIPGVADAGMKDLPPDTAAALPPAPGRKPAETPSPEEELKDAEKLVREMAREIIKKVAWEVVPQMSGASLKGGTDGPAVSAPGEAEGLSQGDARQAVDRIARDIIEKVAWEVVPGLAEEIIKKELSRVKTSP